MIDFPLELGILCWVSSIIFWVVIAMAMVGIVRVLVKKKSP